MLYLDSAVIAEAREAARLPFVGGVSCNPTLLARAMGSLVVTPEQVSAHLAALADAHPGMHYVQTLAQDLDGMVRDACRFSQVIPRSRLVVKIPYSHDGLLAVHRLEKEGVATCVTAVASPLQAYVAATSGASWIAPYCNRITKGGGDGVEAVAAMLEIFERHSLPCRLLVASIKSLQEMEAVILHGAHHVTVPLALLREAQAHPLTNTALEEFAKTLSWHRDEDLDLAEESPREGP